jgi:hypothetical protein
MMTLDSSLTRLYGFSIVNQVDDIGPTYMPNPTRTAFESFPMILVLLPTRTWSAVFVMVPLTTTTLAESPETAEVKAA